MRIQLGCSTLACSSPEDVVHTVGSANTDIHYQMQQIHYPIVPRTASRATSSQTTEMIWVVLEVSTAKIERSMLAESRKRALDRRQKKLWQDISENGGQLSGVSFFFLFSSCKYRLDLCFTVRVLQYRSVAFVTYVSEFNAQFAKEAMACQSLDNDEILNVRWATEDPNPVMKVVEKRRLEDMGQEAIKARMDPRIVDAMRSIRALEEGDTINEDEEYEQEQEEEDDEQPDPKRRRLEQGSSRSVSPPPEQQGQESTTAPTPAIAGNGLLNADTLEGLKYFAEIRKRMAGSTTQQRAAPPPTKTGLGLAEYGSDDED